MSNRGSILQRGRIWVATRAFPIILRTRSPIMIALCMGLMIRPFNSNKGRRVLTISKDMFEDDIRALSDFGDGVSYRGLNLGTFKRLFAAVARDDIAGISPANYNTQDRWIRAKKDYHDFLIRMLPILRRLFKIEAILACNYTYTALQEVSRAAKVSGLPYVVLYKEGMIVPGREAEWSKHWGTHFVSSALGLNRILCLAGPIRNVLAAAQISGLEDTRIRQTGFPRLDYYRRSDVRDVSRSKRARPMIGVFAFEPETAFHYYDVIRDAADGAEVLARMHARMDLQYQALLAFAGERPDVDIVIKLKRGCPSTPHVVASLRRALGGPIEASLPKNVTLTDGWIAQRLILDATLTISLNSLTGVESVLARKLVLTPDYSDFFAGKPWSIFSDWPELTVDFSTAEDIARALEIAESFFADKAESRDTFLQTYATFGDDKLSSEAVSRELAEAIAELPRSGRKSQPSSVVNPLTARPSAK